MAMKPVLRDIRVDDIRPNHENPRMHFPESRMDDLARSIDEIGVLVPVSVFEEEKDGQPPFVLVDGERRWRCAQRLGLDTIPAIVLEQPDSVENLKTMFNIHQVRLDWDDMPTAWALKKLLERGGEKDDEELGSITGLSKVRIKQLRFSLTLPQEYQEYIDAGTVPLNFFFELDRHVIQPLAKQRPQIFAKYTADGIRAAFVDKYLSGVSRDTVGLRDVRPIINVAQQEAGGAEQASDLDVVIEHLISDKSMSITEAYENTVEMVVEASKFVRQCQALLMRYDRLMAKAHTEDDAAMVASALQQLADGISERISAPASS